MCRCHLDLGSRMGLLVDLVMCDFAANDRGTALANMLNRDSQAFC